MSRVDSFELVQRHFFHEIDRKTELGRSVTVPLAMVTALLTGTLSILRIIHNEWGHWELALLILTAPVIISLLRAIVNLAYSQVGYMYIYPCDAASMLEWWQEEIGNGKSDEGADVSLRKMMMVEYAECARHNAKNNDMKAAYLHNANACCVTALCFLIVASVPFLVLDARKVDVESAVTGASPTPKEILQ